MGNLCKRVVLFVFVFFPGLSESVAEEITAESVYKLLSHSIFEIKFEMENIKIRIGNMEGKVQGTTTLYPLLESTYKEKEFNDFKEQLNLEVLAIQKMLTTEKLLLREIVDNFKLTFAELKSEIQRKIASINASLDDKAEEMFDIVNRSSVTLDKGIGELASELNSTTNNVSLFLETMEKQMMSNFEDIETRMISNVTNMQRELHDMVYNNSISLSTGIDELKTAWNSTTNNMSHILEASERSMLSAMKEIEARITNDVSSKHSSFASSVSSMSSKMTSIIQPSLSVLSTWIYSGSSSLSSSISSISSKLEYTIQPSLSSHYTWISSGSSSLSSRISSMYNGFDSRISSLHTRLSREEENKVAFFAQMTVADSYYTPNERIDDFNNVNYNEGNGFDQYTGIFTAPRAGTYLIAVTIASQNNELVIVGIVKDGSLKGYAMAGDESNATGSSIIVMWLYVGSRVWVQTWSYGENKIYIRPYYSFFAGVLID